MNNVGKTLVYAIQGRYFCVSSLANTKSWRLAKGLPLNKTSEGVLTDGADYTFLDGRPTPLLSKQRMRMLKQRSLAEKMIQYNYELQAAIDREQNMKNSREAERKMIIDNRLKPKGTINRK